MGAVPHFSVPHFSLVGNRLQLPWLSLSSKGQVQTRADQGREGIQRQRRSCQETMVQPRSGALVSTQGIHAATFFFRMKTTPKWKMLTTWLSSVHHRGLECKSWKSRDIWSNRQMWPWCTKWSRAKVNRVLPREHTGHSKHPFPTSQETLYTWTSPDGQ